MDGMNPFTFLSLIIPLTFAKVQRIIDMSKKMKDKLFRGFNYCLHTFNFLPFYAYHKFF